ncbi:zinc finger protein 711-like [Arctopsyche grandis]|uniref:zinc finger protein 711-like n=1 Tax=Arctopsyche grandis TaxID=121162 RepID=UPI00406D9133
MLEIVVEMDVLKNSCGACLRPVPLDISNLNDYLKDEYFNITNIKVFNIKNLPIRLCCYCEFTLKRIVRFKEQCIKSFKLLTNSSSKTSERSKRLKTQIYSPSTTFNLHIEPKEDVTYDNEDTKISIYSHINNNDLSSCESDTDYNEILPYEIKIENDSTLLPDEIKEEKTDEVISTVESKPSRNKIDPSYVQLKILTPRQRKMEMKKNRTSREFLNATYKCDKCIKGFSMKITYERHLDKHKNTEGAFVCDVCTLRYSTKKNLQQHFMRHTHRYKCVLCDKVLSDRHGIRHHFEVNHRADQQPLICTVCGKASRNKFSMRKHMVVHKKTKDYKCYLCPKAFLRITELNAHLRRHSGEKPHKCRLCDLSFITLLERNSHELVHSPSKNFYCAECDRCFRSKTLLNQHLRRGAKHVTPDLLKFACDQCEKRYVSKRDLKLHVDRIHLKQRSEVCAECSATFITKSALAWHMKTVHEGYKKPKNIICDTCGRGFSSATLLREHNNTHTKSRPYACKFCDATFAQSGTMHTHTRLVHLKTITSSERQSASKRKMKKLMETNSLD